MIIPIIVFSFYTAFAVCDRPFGEKGDRAIGYNHRRHGIRGDGSGLGSNVPVLSDFAISREGIYEEHHRRDGG